MFSQDNLRGKKTLFSASMTVGEELQKVWKTFDWFCEAADDIVLRFFEFFTVQ